jgi:hypothetical protein
VADIIRWLYQQGATLMNLFKLLESILHEPRLDLRDEDLTIVLVLPRQIGEAYEEDEEVAA